MEADASPIAAATIEEAARWAAALATDEASDEDRAACEAWCRAHPQHRLAFERMRAFDATIDDSGEIERETVRSVLAARGRRGRRIGSAMLGLGLLLIAGSGWLAIQSATVRGMLAEHRTGRGERQAITLADGSRLTLDTDAALDARLDGAQRRVSLFRGRMLADVGHDRRPFVVETPEGTATAMGTAFTVRRDGGATTVTVLQSRVRACARKTGACLELAAGERARIAGAHLGRLANVDPGAEGAWAQGWLAVDDRPVAEVLAELNRYRRTPVAFDAARLGGLRVSGSFPLDDTDRAVEAIARTASLPLSRSADGLTVGGPE